MRSYRNIPSKRIEEQYCGSCLFFNNSPKNLGIHINPEKNSKIIIEMSSYSCEETGRQENDTICSTFLLPER